MRGGGCCGRVTPGQPGSGRWRQALQRAAQRATGTEHQLGVGVDATIGGGEIAQVTQPDLAVTVEVARPSVGDALCSGRVSVRSCEVGEIAQSDFPIIVQIEHDRRECRRGRLGQNDGVADVAQQRHLGVSQADVSGARCRERVGRQRQSRVGLGRVEPDAGQQDVRLEAHVRRRRARREVVDHAGPVVDRRGLVLGERRPILNRRGCEAIGIVRQVDRGRCDTDVVGILGLDPDLDPVRAPFVDGLFALGQCVHLAAGIGGGRRPDQRGAQVRGVGFRRVVLAAGYRWIEIAHHRQGEFISEFGIEVVAEGNRCKRMIQRGH